ncbi:MAG: J domain-containing protein [Rhizobiaceae bacterium]|nr:J domain-containing protein [Rhizobiaceae bacterium]
MKPYSKYFEKIRVKPNRKADAAPHAPRCQWDGCGEAGTHRAPVGRMREGEYFRFCFDHVREYNRNFNYFSGLGNEDIARFQKEAMTGHRPTWKMGGGAKAHYAPDISTARSGSAAYHGRVGDPFGLFGRDRQRAAPRERKLRTLEAKAMETLGLGHSATSTDIKARYKELVKMHHPDANGGDRSSEERFRDVLQAYRVLKQAGLC